MTPREAHDLERRLQNVTEKLLGAFEELDFVHSLAEVLAKPDAVTDLDGYLLRETLTIFRAQGGWVARRGPTGRLETTAVEGLKPAVPEFLTTSLIEALAAEGALPYLVDDLPQALVRRLEPSDRKARLTARSASSEFPQAFIAAPLGGEKEFLGVICLGKFGSEERFAAGDLKLLSTLAIHAGLFMRNADLLLRLKAEAKSLGRRVQELESTGRAQPDLSWIRMPSPAMKRLTQQVEAAAPTEATVLLLGESGTGKSLVARILHRLSVRGRGPFVEINCGAVAPGLIESELFGHARGAFTGADRERAGLFEEADGGTIFLDEIAELPLELQVKLLTVLEQRRVRRVGENRDRPVNVRMIAATNADLATSVRSGRFREDLYYRLNVINLTVPPLRDRPEDILPLARRFLEEIAHETNRRVRGFTPAGEEVLLAYAWPGNVRELRNVVERSLLMRREGDLVEVEPLLESAPRAIQSSLAIRLPERALPEAMVEYERGVILESLRQSGGVVARAADVLGISRTNLHNKLRKHGLERSQSWDDTSHDE